MSLWKRIACVPELEQRMKQYYNEKGLAEIRVQLGQWIEDTIMSKGNATSSADLYEQVANQFCDELRQKIITLANENLLKFKLAEICAHVTQTPPVDLYTHVRNGLQQEIQALKEMPQNPYMYNATPVGGNINGMGLVCPLGDESYGLASRIQKLGVDVESMRLAIQAFQTENESLFNYVSELNHARAMMNPQQIQEREMQLDEQIALLATRKDGLTADLRRIIAEYDIIQENVINELKRWQRNQALAGNGAQFHDNLDEIQNCIEMLVEMVYKILNYVNMMLLLGNDQILSDLAAHVRCAQEVLVLSAFIVERQPPQVMKTHTRFAAAVRWLIGPQLNIHLNNPTVECIILSEAQAQRHSAQRTMGDTNASTPASSGEILNNVSTMEYQQQTRVFSASFRNMQLKKIKRAEKKGTESVMDEKFALLFYTTAVFNEYRIRAWTLSLPVVVIVHGNQEPQSWATITWDNAFSDISREPFQVPEKVPWPSLSAALNMKFGSATGRHLTQDNLNFLYEKLFRNESGDQNDYITWAQFCKEPLPDRTFTFWDWFFAIMKLTKDHLLGLWKEGLIVGFINKRKTTDEILPMTPPGTFLLRFSDSELGGITVAFNNDQGNRLMLAPWTARDLNIRCLADRIHDLTVLRYLYPTNKPRDEAFGEFYTQRIEEQTTRDGYVANTIRAHVPSIETGGLVSTPQHHPQDMAMSNDNFTMSDFDSILY